MKDDIYASNTLTVISFSYDMYGHYLGLGIFVIKLLCECFEKRTNMKGENEKETICFTGAEGVRNTTRKIRGGGLRETSLDD